MKCDCAHASVHHPQKGWCCCAYYNKGETVSCSEAYGSELCRMSAHKNGSPIMLYIPEMLFPEGDIKNTNLCVGYYENVLRRLCDKLGYKMVKK